MSIELNHIEATKARAVVANPHDLTGVFENVLNQIGRYLVVHDFNLELQFPARLEAGANTNHARALHNHRANVQIQRLIRVLVKLIRDGCIVRDSFRIPQITESEP